MKKKSAIIFLVAVILAAGLFGMHQLQRRAKLADIISDEAGWDFLDSLSAAARMEVVILQDDMVARLVSEDEDTFTCDIQDTFTVPKTEARVEIWSAADGRGVVYLKEPGSCPAYSEPDPAAAIVLDLIYEEGCVPDTYPFLGLENGWYRVDMGEQSAYIEAKYVNWDAVDSF